MVLWIAIQKDNEVNPVFWMLDRLRSELARVYGVKLSKPAMFVNLAKMKIRFKRSRPTHIMADVEKQAEYKKTLTFLKVKAERNPNLRVFFFDEARFGLQTSLPRIWALSGEPLQIKVKQAYQNFYIYGSVEPKTGENFSLFLPWVNTDMMNLYLE